VEPWTGTQDRWESAPGGSFPHQMRLGRA